MTNCTQPRCRIAESGICLEGHYKHDCPHIVPTTVTDKPALPTTATELHVPEPFRFYSGEKLTVKEASRLMNGRPVAMVVCAGSQRVGKTTFLARIGEMFRSGSFTGYRFAGSRTLCAFERVSWLATIASGAGRPETQRSHHTERDSFLHLCVKPLADPSARMDVLIADLPGEDFPTALASREFCQNQQALARADHLALFLDSRNLIHAGNRHSELDNGSRFLSQVAKSVPQPPNLRVRIIFSRWDYVTLHADKQAHATFCQHVEAELRQRYSQIFGSLEFDRIAARPKGVQPTDKQIQNLFASWLEPRPTSVAAAIVGTPPERDFCAFGL